MCVLADGGVTRKNTDCFQPKQRVFTATKRRHHGHHAADCGWAKNCSQGLSNFVAGQCEKCIFHDRDTLVHGQQPLDVGMTKNEKVHSVASVRELFVMTAADLNRFSTITILKSSA